MVTRTRQNVVYGDTAAAACCAIQSAQAGASTALVVPMSPGFATSHIGGMLVNGLGATDLGSYGTQLLGTGCTYEFFRRTTGWYWSFQAIYRIEPHTAEFILSQLLRNAIHFGLDIYTEEVLASVQKTGTTINSITTVAGTVYAGTNFADMTYEGDLAAMAGVSMFVGREANNYFLNTAPAAGQDWLRQSESIAGFNPSSLFGIDNGVSISPYADDGVTLLPGVSAYPALAPGAADSAVQASGFRVALTKNTSRLNRFADPGGDPLNYELLRRGLGDSGSFKPGHGPNGKFDWNYDYINYVPGYPQAEWPTATPARRAQLAMAWYIQQASWIYFLATDPSVPEDMQADVNSYGLPQDEFADNHVYTPGWPRYPYIREARHMRGQYVMTMGDSSPGGAITKAHSIGMGEYTRDSHTVAHYPVGDFYVADSNSAVPGSLKRVKPYEIPLEAHLPRTAEIVNLVVGPAGGYSHIAFASFRIEKTEMVNGEALGIVIGLASTLGVAISALDYTTQIAPALTAAGLVLHYTPS